MTVLVVPNLKKANAAAITRQVLEKLQEYGAHIVMTAEDCSPFLRPGILRLSEAEAFASCDAVVTVGGDGTILHTARRGLPFEKPLLGINIGRTGFLATVEADELSQLEHLAKGEYTLDVRGTLAVSINGSEKRTQTVLNDVVIGKTSVSHTIDISIYCDDILVNRYQGDGVVVATPTGSTAYSLSAGGPVLDSKISGIVVTPICAHSMHSPPMVFSAKRQLRVTLSTRAQTEACISCDGMADEIISGQDSVYVSYSKQTIKLISLHPADQFDALDKKLKGR